MCWGNDLDAAHYKRLSPQALTLSSPSRLAPREQTGADWAHEGEAEQYSSSLPWAVPDETKAMPLYGWVPSERPASAELCLGLPVQTDSLTRYMTGNR